MTFEPLGRPRRQDAQVFSIIAFVFAVIAVLVYPIVFGAAAIILGLVGRLRGERLATRAILAGVAGLVLGLLIGVTIVAVRG